MTNFDDSLAEPLGFELSRLDVEWLGLTAVRQVIGIARKRTPTYEEAFEWARVLAPSLYGQGSELADAFESRTIRLYRERAEANSERTGREITPVDLLNADIARLEDEIHVGRRTDTMASELAKLYKARECLVETRYTETQAIVRDAYRRWRDLPISGEGKNYIEIPASGDLRLRVRMLHPDPPESATGADIIYEVYCDAQQLVRLVTLQYKMWNGRNLYDYNSRLLKQLSLMHDAFCKSGFCDDEKEYRANRYRLPYCCAFLRPTNRMQGRNTQYASVGLHIPVCTVSRCWENTHRGKVLRSSEIRSESLTQSSFEELFNIGMLGSRWVDYTTLEGVYFKFGLLDVGESLILHAQEFSAKAA